MMKRTPLIALLSLAACTDVATAPPATAPSVLVPQIARSSANEPIANKYIVRFRDDEPSAAIRAKAIEHSHGAVVERVYTSVMKGAAMTMADDAAEALKSDPHVIAVEQDQVVHVSTTQSHPTWGLDRIDQRNRPYSGSYTYNVTGSGVTVYLIDTGINYTHSEYSGRAFPGVDEVTPGGTAADCDGHGSHVAGTIGGTTYGVAKGVTLISVRVLDCTGSGTVAGVIAGIDWVAQNAVKPAVANMSLGGGFSAALNTSVQNAIATGVTFAVAAGNSTANACNESPSSAPNAITVAASDSTDAFAWFSNFGSCVDIIAPGVNVLSAWIGGTTATNTISGTSMATPHVTGAAALYLETNPKAAPAQVAAALTGAATQNVVTLVPAGTPNALLYTGFIGVGPNQPPVANFTWNCTGLSTNQCALNGSTSTDDFGIVSWTWNWGNGKPSETKLVPTAKNTWAAAGVYTVTLTVTDGGGLTNTQSQQVTVGSAPPPPPNQPPTASISSPLPSASFVQGSSVSFAGTGSDPEDGALSGASLVWTSSINGQIGTGTSFSTTTLSVGTHTITLTATDSKGATGTATRTITITAPNQPPTASITTPANNSTNVVQGTSVSFAGSGSDPEDGALSGGSLVWTSNLDGQIGTGTSFSTTSLSVGQHTITLTATDSKGATGTATRTVTITATPPSNQPPVAAFTVNCTGQTLPHQCAFDATSSTDDVGIVSWKWNWGNGKPAETKTVPTARNTFAASGTYQVTLIVTDGGGLTSSITKSVVVP